MKVFQNRIISAYDKEQFKRKAVNIASFTIAALLITLVISLAVRPSPALPPPKENFYALNLEIKGNLLIPRGARLVEAGKNRYFIEGIKIIIEFPQIPLCIEKKEKEITFTHSGDYNVSVKGLSCMRSPRALNVKARLKGYRECRIKEIVIADMNGTVRIPDITFVPAHK